MKILSLGGIRDFVIATGYKSHMIKDYFLHYESQSSDFSLTLGDRDSLQFHGPHAEADWRVTVAFTGDLTPTGGRVARLARFLGNAPFIVTYGDGLANVNVGSLLEHHRRVGAAATVTAVQPTSRFGVLDIGDAGTVKSFAEKPQLEGWINIGFMVFEASILEHLNEDSILEAGPLERLAREGQLSAYRHHGFWQPMDTYREAKLLNELADNSPPPWLEVH